MIAPPTFPARPVNGGPLPKALPKDGAWYFEPKYNGWRVLVHAPTGTCFNRKGQRLTIEGAFTHALGMLRNTTEDEHGVPGRILNGTRLEWFDCEGLERRHGLGQGTLIVLDWLAPGCYETRTRLLRNAFDGLGIPELDPYETPGPKTLYRPPYVGIGGEAQLWADLLKANARLGCEFYEGVVAKRADSKYPMQLRSPDQEFPFWMKHRWAF